MRRKTEWLIIGIGVFVMMAYLFSLWPGQDAQLGSLGICLDSGSTPLDQPIVASGSTVYVCGTIEETTSMQASIRLYRGDEYLDFWSRNLRLGPFHERISDGGSLPSGDYIVRVVSSRQLMGQTEFQIVE